MNEIKIYVIYGMTGEYSDRSEWAVGACLSRRSADALEKECTDFATQHQIHKSNERRGLLDYDERIDLVSAIEAGTVVAPDRQIRVDYTGVDYCVGELPLRLIGGRDEIDAFVDAMIAAREARP